MRICPSYHLAGAPPLPLDVGYCLTAIPVPSPVDHILSEFSTMTHLSWATLHSMAHSFIELDKASSPARTPKLQLAAEQPWTEECWIIPKQDTPHPRAKEKPQQDGRRGKFMFIIKPRSDQRPLEGSNKSCVHQDPGAPQRLRQNCLRICCGGTVWQWSAAGTGALGVGMA